MTEVSIRDQLKKLLDLQNIDKDIYSFKKDLKEKPAFIEDLKQQFEAKKAKLNQLQEQFKETEVDRKGKELELQSKEEEIAKANTQLSQIKTNKEYQAKLMEIENLGADKSVFEEKILKGYDDVDQINGEIEKEKKVLEAEEKHYLAQKKEVDDQVKEIQENLKILENKRNQITPEIDKANLKLYERILENRNGLAMVPINSETCGGCFMNVPPQVINEIKMNKKLVTCEMCARIFYIEEDLV